MYIQQIKKSYNGSFLQETCWRWFSRQSRVASPKGSQSSLSHRLVIIIIVICISIVSEFLISIFPNYTPYWFMHSSSSLPCLSFRSWWPWSTCTARTSSTAIWNQRTFCSPQTQISHRSLFSSFVVHDIVAKGTTCERFKTQQNRSHHNEISVTFDLSFF